MGTGLPGRPPPDSSLSSLPVLLAWALYAQRHPFLGAVGKSTESAENQGEPQECVQERRTSETSTLRFFTFQPSSCTPLFPLQELPDYLEGQREISSVVPTVPKVTVPSDFVEGAS